MSVDAPVVWWILGAPCTGKSTAAEALARELAGTAHVDVDQLGMCYPEPEGDPRRERLKARAAGTLARRFARAGARRVLVSGVLGDPDGLQEQLGLPVVFCRLDVEPVELRRRLVARYAPEAVARALQEAEELRGSPFPAVVGVGPGVAQRVRRVFETTPAHPARSAPAEPGPGGGRVLLVTRPRGVGRPHTAFARFLEVTATRRAAYLDLDEVGGADNAAALWGQFHAVGAGVLVVSGPVEDEGAFRKLFAGAQVEIVRDLPASPG